MSDGGKGSAPRVQDVSHDTFASNWDRIFKSRQVKSCDWVKDFRTVTGGWYNCNSCKASEFVANNVSLETLSCKK